MCTENKSDLTYEQVVEDNHEATTSCISSISTLLNHLAVTCENHILNSLRVTSDYFRDSIAILSNNNLPSNEYGEWEISGTSETTQNKNEGPVILSCFSSTDSDNSPITNNELQSQSQLKLTTTPTEIIHIHKNNHRGPRVDKTAVQSIDNGYSVFNAGSNNHKESIEYVDPEHVSKPKVKLRNQQRHYNSRKLQNKPATVNQHNKGTLNTSKHQYNESSFNYYWPLDPTHNLDKEGFIQQVNRRKEIQQQFLNTKYIKPKEPATSTSEEKRRKKTHLDQIQLISNFRN
jgi:hypothetical protein